MQIVLGESAASIRVRLLIKCFILERCTISDLSYALASSKPTVLSSPWGVGGGGGFKIKPAEGI